MSEFSGKKNENQTDKQHIRRMLKSIDKEYETHEDHPHTYINYRYGEHCITFVFNVDEKLVDLYNE